MNIKETIKRNYRSNYLIMEGYLQKKGNIKLLYALRYTKYYILRLLGRDAASYGEFIKYAEKVDKDAVFMEKEFGAIADKYSQLPVYDDDITKDDSWKESKIWVYWNDPDSMPLFVKSCIERIKQMSNGHEVILLTEKNLRNYIDFDPIVWKKYEEKKISLTHFSDFTRMAVIAKYGGLYLDATIYPTRPLEDKFFNQPFYSNRITLQPCGICISRFRWSSFMFGCPKGNLFIKATLDLFTEYWKRYDTIMDYLLIDFVWNLLYDHVPAIKEMIDNLPVNNTDIWEQQPYLGKTCSEERFREIMSRPDADMYKFSYKGTEKSNCSLRDNNGKPTLLGRICGEK